MHGPLFRLARMAHRLFVRHSGGGRAEFQGNKYLRRALRLLRLGRRASDQKNIR